MMSGSKSLIGLLLGILLIAGCISQSTTTPTPTPEVKLTGTTCTNTTTETPIVTSQCDNVSYTEQVCQMRNLEYSITSKTKVDLCIASDSCSDTPLNDCHTCTRAMTRCTITVQNNDPKQTGDWTVGANFTLFNAGFIKNPQTLTILPTHNATFDFFQIYSLGYVQSAATCDLYVVNPPLINDCHQETRNKIVCNNVTTMQTTTQQVCS